MAEYKMNITGAKYKEFDGVNIGVFATIDSEEMFIPMNTGNRHYKEILKQVADGDITIAEAE